MSDALSTPEAITTPARANQWGSLPFCWCPWCSRAAAAATTTRCGADDNGGVCARGLPA
jgi:hypothetical protein